MDSQEQERYLIDLRREKVQQLLACKVSQTQIAKVLNLNISTVDKDAQFLRKHARDYVHRYEEFFSEEYKQCLDFLGHIQLEAWEAARSVKYERNKASLLNVCKDCVAMRASLICDLNLVEKTVTFIEQLRKKKKHIIGLTAADYTAVDSTTTTSEDTQTEDNETEEDEQIEVSG